MINCCCQRVVVKERNFVVNALDLKRVFSKTLEKLVIFDSLTPYNTKTLEIDRSPRQVQIE